MPRGWFPACRSSQTHADRVHRLQDLFGSSRGRLLYSSSQHQDVYWIQHTDPQAEQDIATVSRCLGSMIIVRCFRYKQSCWTWHLALPRPLNAQQSISMQQQHSAPPVSSGLPCEKHSSWYQVDRSGSSDSVGPGHCWCCCGSPVLQLHFNRLAVVTSPIVAVCT